MAIGPKYTRGIRLREILTLSLGAAGGHSITLLATPVLARLYTPHDFGFFTASVSISTILVSFASGCFERAIPLPRESGQAMHVLHLSLFTLLFSVLGISVALFFFHADLETALRLSMPALFLIAIPLIILGEGLLQIFSYWIMRTRHFSILARSQWLESAATNLIQIGCWFLYIGAPGLILGYLTGLLLTVFVTARTIFDHPPHFDFHRLVKAARQYKAFPLLSGTAGLLISLGTQGTTLLISAAFGSAVLGSIGLCQQILSIPTALIGASISKTYYPRLSLLRHRRPDIVKRLYLKTVARLGLAALIVGTLGMLLGPKVLVFILGEKWEMAGLYLRWLIPAAVFQFAISAPTNFNAIERQDLVFVWAVIYLSLTFLPFLLLSRVALSPEYLIGIFSANQIIAYSSMFFLFLRALKKIKRRSDLSA